MLHTRLIRSRTGPAALAACVCLCAWAAPAAATGGRDIASAPAVVYDEPQFGNTLTDGNNPSCWGEDCRSWWQLPVEAGDRVRIDFEGTDCMRAVVWPVGTTDYTFEDTGAFDSKSVGSNNKAELAIKAPTTGTMPLAFTGDDCTDSMGPYDFIAYVEHGLGVSLPHKSTRARTGTVKIGVHTPDGGQVDDPSVTVELQAKRSGGSWTGYGKASVAGSASKISYKLPKSFRAKSVSLRAVATGDGYVKTSSATDRSKIS